MTALTAGSRLGPYEILTPIGAGGMGEVYKASDTRLERVVAIKLLPRHWADNPEMRQRFEREAQIIASLSHPNICMLHDIGRQDGVDFLVMEFLDGETLGARIERGPMPWEEAVKVAIAIADALDKAHSKGVVHRDLKPANIILTPAGPKLLDFGLAKWKTATPTSTSATQMPTSTDVTVPGALLGTLQYMAPEQLEGLEADPRTDIFAFGAVLHEMITGKKAFDGQSRVLLMSAIATSEPAALSAAQPETPAALEHLVRLCMAKNPADRWQTARDLLGELKWISEIGGDTGVSARSAGGKNTGRSRWWLAAAAVAVAIVAVPAALYLRAAPPPEFRFHMVFGSGPGGRTTGASRFQTESTFGVSPDGRTLAFVSRDKPSDPWALFIQPIGSNTPHLLPGTEHGSYPFWSADGHSIGFFADGSVRRVAATGGPPQVVVQNWTGIYGGSWNAGGTILLGAASGLMQVSAEGGKPQPLGTLEAGSAGEFWPQFLPDGKHYLYTRWGPGGQQAIMAGMLGSKERTRVLAGESNAAYVEPGFLVFHRDTALFAQPFDPGKLAVRGEPVRVGEARLVNAGFAKFAVSPTGVLVYVELASSQTTTVGADTSEWQFGWADFDGRPLTSPGPPGAWRGFDLSPDGKRIAVHLHNAAGGMIQIIEPRGTVTNLTADATRHESSPIWSPDGARIVYSAHQNGKWGLYQTLSTGSGTPELLYESPNLKAPMSWSPDGKRIVFWVQDAQNRGDLWILTLDEKKAEPFIATPANETHGQISPDGKWIAYTSDSTDGRNEIYVQPFPSGSGRWQITFHGADWPRWRRDTKELFFHAISTSLDSPAIIGPFRSGLLMSVPVTVNGVSFEHDPVREIIRVPVLNIPHSGGDYQAYDISADGQRVLLMEFAAGINGAAATSGLMPDPPGQYVIALNWTAGLKR
jgi:Tol biopolymer transport system component